MPLFRALAKNMAPMTNADESPTNRLTLFPIYLSLFVVSARTLQPFASYRLALLIKQVLKSYNYIVCPLKLFVFLILEKSPSKVF